MGEGEGGTILSPPMSIRQDPTDVDGEVFGGRMGGEESTSKKETRVFVIGGGGGDESA